MKKYGTRNPLTLAQELGIHIRYKEYTDDTKGYFVKLLRNKFIIVNSNLSTYDQHVVIAHELGHALLHHSKGDAMIREYTLFP
ncbi:MAG: ImmA/IrrE family metallo-endopeptidase, partial [Clostridium sp.]